jgi:hypothetical protein
MPQMAYPGTNGAFMLGNNINNASANKEKP